MNANRRASRKACYAWLGAAALGIALPAAAHAQGQAVQLPMLSQAPPQVPTIKILAIGSFVAEARAAEWQERLPDEVRETVRLYLNGTIDEWFVKQDQSGVVFIMNTTDITKAKKLLEQLPFVKNKIMKFELIPLGPLSPLAALLRNQSN